MKKTDVEILSLALLATACGQKPNTEDGNATPAPTSAPTTATPLANEAVLTGNEQLADTPANSAAAQPAPVDKKVTRNVKSSIPRQALERTGRGGGRSNN